MRLGKVSSGFVFASYRCVDRGCPTSPQARRSLAPCACRTCATAALLSCGLTIFSNQILQHRDVQCLTHETTDRILLWPGPSLSSSFHENNDALQKTDIRIRHPAWSLE